MTTLESHYRDLCGGSGVKPNSLLLQQLRSDGPVRSIDLNDNLVGPNGALVVAALIARHCEQVHTARFARNNLKAGHTSSILRLLDGHPSLAVVDFSGNPITSLGGRDILSFVRRNDRVVEFSVADTRVNPAQVRLVEKVLEARARLPPVQGAFAAPISDGDDCEEAYAKPPEHKRLPEQVTTAGHQEPFAAPISDGDDCEEAYAKPPEHQRLPEQETTAGHQEPFAALISDDDESDYEEACVKPPQTATAEDALSVVLDVLMDESSSSHHLNFIRFLKTSEAPRSLGLTGSPGSFRLKVPVRSDETSVPFV